jgi:DNA gyrase subunit A
MIIRQRVSEISVVGRNTLGVRLINLAPNDVVRDISLVHSEPDEESLDKEVETLKTKPASNLEEFADMEDEEFAEEEIEEMDELEEDLENEEDNE